MAPRKNHTCKYGKKENGYCAKKSGSGLSRSAAMKLRWSVKRSFGGHACKYGKKADGYCKKKKAEYVPRKMARAKRLFKALPGL